MTGNLPGDWEQVSIPALIDDEYIALLPEHVQKLIPHDVERDEKGRLKLLASKETLKSLLQLEKGWARQRGCNSFACYTFSSQHMQQPKKLKR